MTYLKVWTSFLEIIKPLQYDEVGRLFEMMLLYADSGEEPEEFEGNERFIWPVAKQQIDLAIQKCETLRQNGLKGGRPKASETKENQTESKNNQDETKENQTKAYNINIKKSKDNDKVKDKSFTPPSVEEVKQYCQERSNGVDPQRFVDFYSSKGWMVGKNKMKDWRAAVRTWEKGDSGRQAPQKTVIAQQYSQRDYSGAQEKAAARFLAMCEEPGQAG